MPSHGGGIGSVANSTTYNLCAKIGYQFTEEQRLQLSVNYLQHRQHSDFIVDGAGSLVCPDVPPWSVAVTFRVRGLQ